ncbi:Protein of unknown function [Flavobacterium micromati]|jgi:hypothetical protein|uniref:DUF2490 domain-containing protein n=1 Tax=Flavobacterium micromati TaxID=229205 RepID=A0A1M5FTT4_9FLAO|nr:DUF2490 domain-containing protein [Flavobacterium micromati]MCL6460902.1 DUF2490 domain-containing protein [Flavobacterium micromati]SHF94582.1 Protein of unknown function [Flavobacterium micromati]
MKNKVTLLAMFALLTVNIAFSQNTRLEDANQIGWINYFGTFKLDSKFGIHTEYQLRRDNYVTDKQQGLLRVGLNYQANPKLQLRLGYAAIETYPYGDIPINGMGKDFTEHRIYQMATVSDKISNVDISHRFMLEQRWIGRYTRAELTTEDDFLFLNRLRYMVRLQVPLKGKSIQSKTPYVALYNEIFIGFGPNVNENIFDQNRLGALLGYKFNDTFRIEGGFLNQIVQLGREVNNRNVFQNNSGFIINSIFNFDLSKKK